MYAPMLATTFKGLDVRPYLNGPYSIQQKFDGDHLMGIWRAGSTRPLFVGRNGSVYTKAVPKALKDLVKPPSTAATTAILDGELVGDTWHVFDMLLTQGKPEDLRPCDVRRLLLEHAFSQYQDHPNMRLVPESTTSDDKAVFLGQALERGVEGVVVKHLRSPYWFGRRVDSWVKIKFERTADVIILSTRTNGKESAEMVVRDPDRPNPIVNVGDVSLLGKGDVQPGMVVEVKYLYATENNRLYQPRILRIRNDKSPSECTIDQLVYTDKGALVR